MGIKKIHSDTFFELKKQGKIEGIFTEPALLRVGIAGYGDDHVYQINNNARD